MPVGRHGRRVRLLTWHSPRVPHPRRPRLRAPVLQVTAAPAVSPAPVTTPVTSTSPAPPVTERAPQVGTMEDRMTSTGLRIYTTVIALICGGAVAWSIHQASLASSWQADARSGHAVAQRTVTHDRVTTNRMRHLVVRSTRSSFAPGAPSGGCSPACEARRRRAPSCLRRPRSRVWRLRHRRRRLRRPPPPRRPRTRADADGREHRDDRRVGTARHRHHLAHPSHRPASTPAAPPRSRRRSSATRPAGRASGPTARSRA